MRKYILSGVANAVLSLGPTVAASAADLPAKAPVYKAPPVVATNWSGFYVGGAVGLRAADADANLTSVLNNGVNILAADCAALAPFGGCQGQQFDSSGVKGGVYAGYNWQFAPRWVAGIEGDWMWADHDAALRGGVFPSTPGDFALTGEGTDSFAVRAEWDASIRGRLGFLVTPSILVFGTGGASWLKLETTSACNTVVGICSPGALAPGTVSVSDTVVGWTIGGGIEAMLSPNWLIRGEYRYADYGTNSYSIARNSAGLNPVSNYDVDLKTHSALFGIAYKFGSTPAGAEMPIKATVYNTSPTAAYGWSGFYVGGAAGFRSADVEASLTSVTNNGVEALAPACAALLNGCAGQQLDSTGFKGGVYGGYNWQFAPQWLVGIEGDWMWADHEATFKGGSFPSTIDGNGGIGLTGVANDSFSVQTDWDASIRGRLGFLVTPSVLVYGTGGVSWLKLETTSVCNTALGNCAPGGFTQSVVSVTDTVVGWTIGGGIEAMLAPNWLIRGEYRYADYGSNTYSITRTSPGLTRLSTYDVDLKTHTALFGIAYKFGPAPVVAKY